jgi:hypothetical protein
MKNTCILLFLLSFSFSNAATIEGKPYKISTVVKKEEGENFKKEPLDSEVDIFLTKLISKKTNEKNFLEIKKIIPKSCHDNNPESELRINYECKNSQIKKIRLGIEDYSGKIVGKIILNTGLHDSIFKKISEILKNSGKKNSEYINWNYFGSKNHMIILLNENENENNVEIQFIYLLSHYPG